MGERKKRFNPAAFGRNIRVRTAQRNIHMYEAAREIGCSAATLSRICHGKSPSVENYLRIRSWLGLPPQPPHEAK